MIHRQFSIPYVPVRTTEYDTYCTVLRTVLYGNAAAECRRKHIGVHTTPPSCARLCYDIHDYKYHTSYVQSVLQLFVYAPAKKGERGIDAKDQRLTRFSLLLAPNGKIFAVVHSQDRKS
jgi:hypothetical protein